MGPYRNLYSNSSFLNLFLGGMQMYTDGAELESDSCGINTITKLCLRIDPGTWNATILCRNSFSSISHPCSVAACYSAWSPGIPRRPHAINWTVWCQDARGGILMTPSTVDSIVKNNLINGSGSRPRPCITSHRTCPPCCPVAPFAI